MMEKQRTHLTPEEVKEFEKLGVKLRGLDTFNSWLLDTSGEWSIETTETAQWFHATPDSIYTKIICAPSLQEVLEVLPKEIKAKGGIYQTLRIERYSSIEEWSAGYGIEVDFSEPNLLDAVVDLLRWVCENYSETLVVLQMEDL